MNIPCMPGREPECDRPAVIAVKWSKNHPSWFGRCGYHYGQEFDRFYQFYNQRNNIGICYSLVDLSDEARVIEILMGDDFFVGQDRP